MFERIKHFNFHSLFATTTYGRTLTLVGILLIVVALPVTVTVLQQRTQTQQHAAFTLPPGGGGSTCASVGGTCGVNSDCCNGGTTTYCNHAGKCQNYCTQTIQSGVCNGDYTCTATYNPNRICAPTIYTGCTHVSGKCGYVAPPTLNPGACTKPVSQGGKGGSCAPIGVCNGIVGSTTVDVPQFTCATGQVCCIVKPTPVAPRLSCGQGTDPKTGQPYQKQGTCMPASSLGTTCATGYTDPEGTAVTSCFDSGQICCTQKLAPTPPPPKLPNGEVACGTNNKGVCYWQAKSAVIQACLPKTDKTAVIFTCNNTQPAACSTIAGAGATESTVNTGSCQNPNNVNAPFRCCIPAPTLQNNDCTNNGGSCLVSSSQGSAPCGTPLPDFNNACDTVARNTFCCKKSSIPVASTDNSCTTVSGVKGTCIPNNVCPAGTVGTGEALQSPTCSAKGFRQCCVPGANGTGGTGGSGGTGGGAPAGPSCTPGQATQFAMNIKLPGIGSGTFENNEPKHPTKHASIVIKDGTGNIIQGASHDFSHALSHANGNGKLAVARMATPQLVCGNTYHVEVKIPGYITIKKDIVYGDTAQTLEVAESDITAGDIVGDGTTNTITPDNKIAGDDVIDISDYNVFRACHDDPGKTFQFTNNTQTLNLSCPDLINLFDFQDGGVGTDANGISEFADNYNLWLRGFLKFNGK